MRAVLPPGQNVYQGNGTLSLLLVHPGEAGEERRHDPRILSSLNILCGDHAGKQAPGHPVHWLSLPGGMAQGPVRLHNSPPAKALAAFAFEHLLSSLHSLVFSDPHQDIRG